MAIILIYDVYTKLRNLVTHYFNGQTYNFNIGILKIAMLNIYCDNTATKRYQLPISFQSADTYAILIEPNKNIGQSYNGDYGMQTTRVDGNTVEVASKYPSPYGCRLVCIGV